MGAVVGKLVLGKHRTKPQRRIGRPSDWTKAKADRFIEVLADTCNVTLAAKAIERSVANVYRQREKNASFRASWDAALAMGYARLELMMLERALHGVEKKLIARDGTTTVMREYPDRVALTLLRMHRETVAIAGERVERDEYDEAYDRIIARLDRLRERDQGEVETKSVVDRIAVQRPAPVRTPRG
jgi:hypothetical protein